MNTNRILIVLVLISALLLTGCNTWLRVGELKTESRTIELGNARSVTVEINFGAGDLEVTGGAEKLLEAKFNYNVEKLKPEVKYSNGTLVVQQPEGGTPSLVGIGDFRNEWNLHLNNKVPMDLSLNLGAGDSDLKLADLSLSRLDINLGAGTSAIDLSNRWARELDVSIKSGAASITVRLPKDVGVRVEIDRGPTMVGAPGMTKNGNVYTNAAYNVSDVTLQIKMDAGIGQINLEVEE